MSFKKAVKLDAKGRVALIGPAGSGKSLTMLKLARALAGPAGKIAAIDTEHGSLSKYADMFEFDVNELDAFPPDAFMSNLKAAEDAGYAVFCCDSLSHFWMGQSGALEWVDNAKRRSTSRDDMAGWKDFAPLERRMIDAMIASPCHIIVTMRTKTEYQEEEYTNARGERKKKRVKIGLAPVQRQGLEYEFDLVGMMDEDNTLIIDKTRCPAYSGRTLPKPSEKDFQPLIEWLKGGVPEPPRISGPKAPAQQVIEQTKVAVMKAGGSTEQARQAAIAEVPEAAAPMFNESDVPNFDDVPDPLFDVSKYPEPWKPQSQHSPEPKPLKKGKSIFDIPKEFAILKAGFERMGRVDDYYEVLGANGVTHSDEFPRTDAGVSAARECYREMKQRLDDIEANAAVLAAERK